MREIDLDLAAVEHAEARLDERAQARAEARARRERRRELMGGSVELVTLVLPLATGATVVLVILLALSGGDLSGWPRPLAILAALAFFAAPAGIAARRWRGREWWEAAAAAVATLGVQLALTFGVAFLLLGLGPR